MLPGRACVNHAGVGGRKYMLSPAHQLFSFCLFWNILRIIFLKIVSCFYSRSLWGSLLPTELRSDSLFSFRVLYDPTAL